jgi:hypothetical protein
MTTLIIILVLWFVVCPIITYKLLRREHRKTFPTLAWTVGYRNETIAMSMLFGIIACFLLLLLFIFEKPIDKLFNNDSPSKW